MKDFIHNLYANPNFPIYLGIVIIVLLLIFVVVYFLGKKDKEKIEKTQRLEMITDNAFSEVSTPVKVETESDLDKTIAVPTINQIGIEPPIIEKTVPQEETPVADHPEVEMTVSLPENVTYQPEEVKPQVNYNNLVDTIDTDLKEMEAHVLKPTLNEKVEPPITLPRTETVEQKEIPVDETFNSVSLPKKEPVLFDDTVEIELPRLK